MCPLESVRENEARSSVSGSPQSLLLERTEILLHIRIFVWWRMVDEFQWSSELLSLGFVGFCSWWKHERILLY